MGARAQVHIKDTGVYLYTHWGSGRLESDVRTALAKKRRWDDSEYLTRIIFDVMKGNDHGETGFGISTSKHEDIELLITIDCDTELISVEDMYDSTRNYETTFKEFIAVGDNVSNEELSE